VTAFLRRYQVSIGIATAVAVLGIVVGVVLSGGTPSRTIYAQFREAPGLYPGNHVDVLGIPVGVVTAVKAEADDVLVTMHVRSSYKIPANAGAEIMAPQVVADRFVQLVPAYGGGVTMPARTVIPVTRTAIPQSVDAIYGTLNQLAQELGPTGANKNGAVSDLLHRLAAQFGGTGPDLHGAVVNFSQALHAVAQNSPAVAQTLNNLGGLSQALAANSGTYASFAGDLTAVSGLLANDRSDVGAVLSSLQQLFANLTNFIEADGASLGSSIDNLKTFAGALDSDQAALAEAFDLTPLSLQNLDNAVDKTAPGGPALRGRYDPVASTPALFNRVCGNAALRFLVILATGTETNPLTVATPVDSLCAVGNALNALTPPPGASAGPDLSLQALTS
jgi:phospholipid/cholesterol/gamma-HCH transport system substrate-binding protein